MCRPTSTCANYSKILVQGQPFRLEISLIQAIYIADGSPRQLNLTSNERGVLYQAMSTTTNPSAFQEVVEGVEWFLRQQSHPNFIRWSTSNSNRSRLLCARIFSAIVVTLGLAVGMLPIFSSASRGWRVLSFIMLFPGLLVFVTAWWGACVVSRTTSPFVRPSTHVSLVLPLRSAPPFTSLGVFQRKT